MQGSADVLLDRFLEIHRASPFDVILPCLDGEVPRFIQIENELRTAGIRTLLPSQKAFDRRTKKELFSGKIKRSWGAFEIPNSVLVRSPEELRKAIKELGVPVVLKGPISGAIPAHGLREAESALRVLLAQGINEVIVQPKYAGDHLAILTVCGRDFQAVRPVTVKKLVTCQRGSTWAAISMPQPNLEIDFARFLAEIQWCGPVEGEFIRDRRQETFHLIEVNPRFTAWNYFAAALGVNQAFDAACLALGAPVSADPGTRDSGDIFVRSCEDIPASILDFASVAARGRLENVI